MNTSLERIRAKIAELEKSLDNLRIAERELQAFETPSEPKPKARTPKAKATEEAPARQTIGAAIAEVLTEHGALAVGEIADFINAAGREINKRAVSFSLQALKRRGVVTSADGKWMLPKARSRQARS